MTGLKKIASQKNLLCADVNLTSLFDIEKHRQGCCSMLR